MTAAETDLGLGSPTAVVVESLAASPDSTPEASRRLAAEAHRNAGVIPEGHAEGREVAVDLGLDTAGPAATCATLSEAADTEVAAAREALTASDRGELRLKGRGVSFYLGSFCSTITLGIALLWEIPALYVVALVENATHTTDEEAIRTYSYSYHFKKRHSGGLAAVSFLTLVAVSILFLTFIDLG